MCRQLPNVQNYGSIALEKGWQGATCGTSVFLQGKSRASLVAQRWRIRLPMQETQEMWVRFLGWKDPLEKEMATHSSILAWENSMEQRSRLGYCPWGHKRLDATEHSWMPFCWSDRILVGNVDPWEEWGAESRRAWEACPWDLPQMEGTKAKAETRPRAPYPWLCSLHTEIPVEETSWTVGLLRIPGPREFSLYK